MKINKYVEDLKVKSAAELNEELVAAKKELFNLSGTCGAYAADTIPPHFIRAHFTCPLT